MNLRAFTRVAGGYCCYIFPSIAGISLEACIKAHPLRWLYLSSSIVSLSSCRAYSEYSHTRSQFTSPDHFHFMVVRGLKALDACIKAHSLRWCAYRSTDRSARWTDKSWVRQEHCNLLVDDHFISNNHTIYRIVFQMSCKIYALG